MDPIAHTLFGATLAETGLKRRTRYATATLLIGANLPDIDAVAGLWGDDFSLFFRRGHTHGIVALVVLPLLLAGAMALWHRWRSARRGPDGRSATGAAPSSDSPPLRPRALIALAFLAVWSHPLLDWLNTYGVRLLMPFDGRWFYGDTLFIVDPWFWLLTAAGVVLARSQSWRTLSGWALLALLASALILTTNLVPLAVKTLWCVGVALVVALRWRRPAWTREGALARVGLAGLVLYIGAAFGLARMAEAEIAQRFPSAQQVQANGAPALPAVHRLVVVEPDRYRIVDEEGAVHEVPRVAPDAIVQRALADPSIRGFATWTRFPTWTVEEADDHWRVRFRDLRYQGPDVENPRGIGAVEVRVPKDAATHQADSPAP